MKRLLVPHLQAQANVTVEGEAFHHLVHVLRTAVGEGLEVFNGEGQAFEATVSAIEAQTAVLTLGKARQQTATRHIYIVQGLPKGDKLETILQKATELGATAFLPVEMLRSVARISEGKEEKKTVRLQKIVEEASRQCGRADVPKVFPPCRLKEALALLPAGTRVWVLDETETHTPLSLAHRQASEASPLAIVIGPEGGLDDKERAFLTQHGATRVSLGTRILRTETASLAALSVVQHLDGQLG